MDDLSLTVNGQRRPLTGTRAHTTALEWLRDVGLSGSKEGCAEGECGACAVLVAQADGSGGTTWTSVHPQGRSAWEHSGKPTNRIAVLSTSQPEAMKRPICSPVAPQIASFPGHHPLLNPVEVADQ